MSVRVALGVILAGVLACGRLHAQARPTATSDVRFEVFGMGTAANPEFYPSTKAAGLTVGGDMNFRGWGRIRPSVEVRYGKVWSSHVSESVFQGGPRIEVVYGRWHPNVYFMGGYGSIHFANPLLFSGKPYAGDNSGVVTAGGGVDFDLTDKWAIKVDAQAQRWQIGDEDQPFTPYQLSVGVRYNLHFRHEGEAPATSGR